MLGCDCPLPKNSEVGGVLEMRKKKKFESQKESVCAVVQNTGDHDCISLVCRVSCLTARVLSFLQFNF